MNKRRPSIDSSQLDLFASRSLADGPAAFAGVEARVAAEVGRALKCDPRTREEIAGAMSASLADEISRWMLDAYASPGRDTHNISFGRALALMAVTGDRALIEWAVGQLGGTILWGEEIVTARLGHLKAQELAIKAEIRRIQGAASPIERKRA